ncbi:MAG TPA: hypothetical protein VF396_17270 [Bradyrhizobium sp.]|jgi:hypothetical protein
MIAPRSTNVVVRALISAIWIGAGAGSAMAQSYSVNGQVGYLQEWEMKANLAKTITSSGVSYDGPVTLRHVGLCSVNGLEEKSGVVRLTVSRRTSAVEGTLAMKDDTCRIVASASKSHSGLLNCRDGQGVPISFSIDETADTDQNNVRAEK